MRAITLSLLLLCAGGCSDGAAGPSSGGAGGVGGTGSGAAGGSDGGSGGSVSTGGSGGSGGTVETAVLHRAGRFDDSDPNAPTFSWSGTSLRTRLDGTAISVTLGGASGVFFEIVVDGVSLGKLETTGGDTSYPLASGLPAGEHDVEIVRDVEGFFGNVSFLGFSADDGTLVESPSPYQHRLEIIGDSITCGYGIEGADAFCNFSGDTENAFKTYGAIAARNVAASAHLIAYSGKGVFQNYGGDKTELMPELYQRTLTNAATPTWDFTSYVPEAVVLNLGTNDFSANITQNEFVGAYVDFLAEIRGHYPDAAIFCVSWEMWGATHQAWIGDAITQSGDPNLHEVVFSVVDADGWGCDYHPGTTMHDKLGATLTTALEQTMGW